MKKSVLVAVVLLCSSSGAFAQFGQLAPGQFPGQFGDNDRYDRNDGFGRSRGDFERCGYNAQDRNYWSDLGNEIQDVIEDAQDIQALANRRFSRTEDASTFGQGQVVDAYLAVG